jgi:uncharacterized protein (TIGR03067 family)
MCKYAILLAAAVSLAFAPAPFPKPPKPESTKDDAKKLQGTWLKVQSVPPGNGEGSGTLLFTGECMRYSLNGNLAGEYSLRIDAKKKPKVFDFKGTGGLTEGLNYRGIYRLERDTLTICYVRSENDRDRPADFDTGKEDVIQSVYKRQKP